MHFLPPEPRIARVMAGQLRPPCPGFPNHELVQEDGQPTPERITRLPRGALVRPGSRASRGPNPPRVPPAPDRAPGPGRPGSAFRQAEVGKRAGTGRKPTHFGNEAPKVVPKCRTSAVNYLRRKTSKNRAG